MTLFKLSLVKGIILKSSCKLLTKPTLSGFFIAWNSGAGKSGDLSPVLKTGSRAYPYYKVLNHSLTTN